MDEQTCFSSGHEKQIVTINVGGTLFQCYSTTLQRFPESKLANLEQQKSNYIEKNNQYFFDRDPRLFGAVLDAYRKGRVHVPKDTCGETFKEELEFWDVSPTHVSPCCWETLYKSEDDINTMVCLLRKLKLEGDSIRYRDNSSWKYKLWLVLDDPNSSRLALVWGVFISIMVFGSILVTCLQTLPKFWRAFSDDEMAFVLKVVNFATNNITEDHKPSIQNMKPSWTLYVIDAVCSMFFSLEMLVYLVVCPSKRQFIRCWIRICTLIGYVCFWLAFVMEFNFKHLSSVYSVYAYIIIRYMVILKVFRVFQITKHTPTFKLIGLTFEQSKQELKILTFLLAIMTCFFGFLMFAVELTHLGHSDITNGFNAMYWALITLTTVGYGDYVPSTTAGHVVAAVCSVCGVLVLALPVGVIASTFYNYYNYQKYASRHTQIEEKKQV